MCGGWSEIAEITLKVNLRARKTFKVAFFKVFWEG